MDKTEMSIEVLLSTMHQDDLSIIEKCNIRTSCLIVNQCNKNGYMEKDMPFGKCRMISTTDRGLSKSRNVALENSIADICVICDDDMKYINGYERIILGAFNELHDADIIVFNTNSISPNKRPQESLFIKAKRVPWYKTYSSVHIAFKRERIIENHILFDERFGTGSNLYSMGEDSLFFVQTHKAKLKSFTYPAIIADLSSEYSTWFNGYNNKFFYDVGAFLAAAYPRGKHFLKIYYPIRFRRLTKLSARTVLKNIDRGIKGFQNNLPFTG